jgi:hypothetical protein
LLLLCLASGCSRGLDDLVSPQIRIDLQETDAAGVPGRIAIAIVEEGCPKGTNWFAEIDEVPMFVTLGGREDGECLLPTFTLSTEDEGADFFAQGPAESVILLQDPQTTWGLRVQRLRARRSVAIVSPTPATVAIGEEVVVSVAGDDTIPETIGLEFFDAATETWAVVDAEATEDGASGFVPVIQTGETEVRTTPLFPAVVGCPAQASCIGAVETGRALLTVTP